MGGVSWRAACCTLRAKLLTPAAGSVLAPAPEARIIIHRLCIEVVEPRTHIVVVFVGHLAIRVVQHNTIYHKNGVLSRACQ